MNDKIAITHSHATRAPFGYETIPLVRIAEWPVDGDGLHGCHPRQGDHRYGRSGHGRQPGAAGGTQASAPDRQTDAQLHHRCHGRCPAGRRIRRVPPLTLGPIIIQAPFITVSDLQIFERWHMTSEPAMLIGIDTLGLLDNLVIDYRRMELQVRTRHNWDESPIAVNEPWFAVGGRGRRHPRRSHGQSAHPRSPQTTVPDRDSGRCRAGAGSLPWRHAGHWQADGSARGDRQRHPA